MATKARVARESARVATGVVALAVGVVAVGAAILLPIPGFSITPPSSTVTPVPTSQQRVCPGPLYELAADASAATDLTAFGPVATEAGAGTGSPAPSLSSLQTPDDTAAGAQGAPKVVTVPATSDASVPQLAAAQSQTAGLEDITGLATAACAEPTPDSWLVGGSTTLGQTSLVLLSNPGSVQATVNLSIYGGSGPIDAAASQGILVPPHSQKVIPLSGLAPSVAMPVVHVDTVVGQVLASMQQSFVDGIQPEGAELVGATSDPATQQVISGLTLAAPAAPIAGGGSESYPVSYPALRLLDTGSVAATVRIGISGERGTAAGNSLTATIQPGEVTEVPLTGLAAGSFTVNIDSDQPVVAAARTTSSTSTGTDFAWFVASQKLSGQFLVAVPQGPGAVIHLANTSRSAQSIAVTGPKGSGQRVSIPAQTSVGVPVSAAGVYSIAGANSLVASVGYSGPGLLSSFAVDPPAPLAAPITVYPR